MTTLSTRRLATAAAILVTTSSAFANNLCQHLGVDPASLTNGQMFMETSAGWQPFDSLAAYDIRSRTRLHFAYVVRSNSDNDRSGVLVIKSNRPAKQTDKDAVTKRVLLTRQGVSADPGCPPLDYLPNQEAYVSTDAYVDYHDYPARDTMALRRNDDGKTIYRFHFSYRSGVKNGCVRTDDQSYDAFPLNWNSNRAQTSYDSTVVATGSYSVVGLFIPAPSPLEGSADHRTEFKKYSTSGTLSCTEFYLPADSADYSIRINDLEGRELPPSNRRLPEQRWPR